ncbi:MULTISPECIES: hypothetical protein [unclassified Streptomyces]|uniref:hypothetical protein n=1 Tax=unclassified Streptomyces TaxID=2593676 RepID=UPI0034080985
MNDHNDDALHAAFQAVLSADPEPTLPSVVDAAVVGGFRIRRRRAALATAGALIVVASMAAVAVNLSWLGGEQDPAPLAPASTAHPTPHTPEPARTAEPLPSGD